MREERERERDGGHGGLEYVCVWGGGQHKANIRDNINIAQAMGSPQVDTRYRQNCCLCSRHISCKPVNRR